MMIERVLSRSLRLMFAGTLVLGAQAVQAQEAPMQRVEVTGSSIKRLAAETSLPVTVIKADDFAKQGLTTASDVLTLISSNQTNQSSSQSVGAGTGGQAQADLRGIGADKTLVLLNGRRIASHPFNGSSVDLNMIPVAALERVEVLRDGASAVYGTDAIGGVINFITKRSVTGMQITAETSQPTKAGGGDENRVNILGGFGDLNSDGYNVYGVVDVHQQAPMSSTSRDFSKTGVIPSAGLNKLSGTPFPANFYSDNGISGNPGFATGCKEPFMYPRGGSSIGTCGMDTTATIQNIPKTQQESFLGKATFKLGEDHIASAEYLHARSTNESRIAAPPMSNIGIIMHGNSPYYPGRGITPAVAGLTGEDLDISWRPTATGQRVGFDTSTSDRLVLASEGVLAGWDYKAGLTYAVSKAASAFTGGYLVDQRVIDGIGAGIVNPFGAQSAAGTDYLANSLLVGEYLNAKMTSTSVDFKVSRELMQLPAGAVGLALGTEFRKDKAEYQVNRSLASQASSSGYADAQDQQGDRKISAFFGEVNVPIIKDLEMNVAARYDHYDDVGNSFTPKVSLRYQPTKQVLLRTSYNTGFRAPTLYDLHGPQTVTFSSDQYNDPKLCPGGKPAAGANPNVACDSQQWLRAGGNNALAPEKSKTFSAGIVLEPVNNVTVSLDYWSIKLRNRITQLTEQTIFGDTVKYKDLFHYSADGTTLLYVDSLTNNLGEMKTSGIDVSLLWKLPQTAYGKFSLSVDGTWVQKYEYQNERGGAFVENVGIYAAENPVFRWKHNAALTWSKGNWSANLSQKFLSGYTDQNAVAAQYKRDVKFYSTFALATSYVGIKNVELTAGIKNLFDTDPPFTNQGTTFQTGYDPRYTDPLGRTFYARATYKF